MVIEAITRSVAAFPDLPLVTPELDQLQGRDGAFAHAILDAVHRRWLTLRYILSGFSSRPWDAIEPRVRAVLLSGAAQLLLLDRVPAHAALDQSVRYAKARVRSAAGGMVNAVLRRVSEQVGERGERPDDWAQRRDLLVLPAGGAVALRDPLLPGDWTQRLSVQTSIGVAVLERWAERFGPERTAQIALKAVAPAPTVLHLGALETRAPDLVARGLAQPHARRGSVVWTADRAALVETLAQPGIWAQDPASSHVVETLRSLAKARGRTPRLIVDLCAGQGTKTRQLRAAFPASELIACDVDDARLRALARALAGDPRALVVHADRVEEALAGRRADLVLLDVPCSNSGVLARRVEARYRLTRANVEQLVDLQRRILDKGRSLLDADAWLVYSTCSIEAEENEQQALWFAAQSGSKVIHEEQTLPEGLPGGAATVACDGSFVVIFERRAKPSAG